MGRRSPALDPDPRSKPEDFDRALKALLDSGPVTREEVHKEARKRKKKALKAIEGNMINRND
jgi:hypothetical protein